MVKRIGLGLVVGLALISSAPPAWSQSDGPASAKSALDSLHHALNLSSAQESAWNAYRAGATAPGQAQDRREAASRMLPNLTAPQRMDLVEAEMRQELADLQQQSQTVKTFYASLSPQQQAVFDAQTLPAQGSQQRPDR